MVLPFISSIMRDVFETVPPVLKESAYGARRDDDRGGVAVVLPYTRIGVVGGILLGLGRALGETMAVTFVIGNSHHINASILQPGTTISAALANEFTEAVGDLYLSSLIALGLILFVITFIVLAIAKLHADPAANGRREAERDAALCAPPPGQLRRRRRCRSPRPAFGLLFLVLVLWTLLINGIGAIGPTLFTQMTPPPGSAAACSTRSSAAWSMTAIATLIGTPTGILAGTFLAEYARGQLVRRGRALHQRHPAERAVDHHRPVRLRGDGRADGPFLGLGRGGGAGDHHDPGRRAHHRGHAAPGAERAARGRGGARRAEMEGRSSWSPTAPRCRAC